MPDNYSQWQERDREQEAWLAKLLVCTYCMNERGKFMMNSTTKSVPRKNSKFGRRTTYNEDFSGL